METLSVGMYCRYNNFQNKIKIAKIKGIQKADEVFQYDYIDFDNDDGELETNIIKASYNIVDILEVGDYVNENIVLYKDTGIAHNQNLIVCIGRDEERHIYDETCIKSIVTHEQMEQMSYKVDDI